MSTNPGSLRRHAGPRMLIGLGAAVALCLAPASGQTTTPSGAQGGGEPASPCPTVAEAAVCAILTAAFEGPDLPDGNNLLVVHYNAGVTQATADLTNAAFLELRNMQLASSQSLPDPQNHALNLVLPLATSDGTNLPPALLTLDAALGGVGEPGFGGIPAVWTLDHYSGVNAPGELSGARTHTLMFGGLADGVCDLALTDATPAELLAQLVLHIEDGVLHSVVGPEIELTTATTWDGSAFTIPVPGLDVVEPFLFGETRSVDAGHVTTPSLLTGSAEPGLVDFVTVWTAAPCERGTLSSVASNRLGLDLVEGQTCYATGDLIAVELGMSCLDGDTAGFFASVSFDPTVLALQAPLSSYTLSPFPLHIGVPILDVGGGTVLLDGSLGFVDPGTDADALLATLVFEVLPGNDGLETAVSFSSGGSFPSELSFAGLGIPTRLGNPLSVTIDDVPPVLVCPADIAVPNDPGTCGALLDIAPPPASDPCGLLGVSGVRSDGLPLDAPFPAGCSPGQETIITWTATDCAGLTAVCSQSVRVIDVEAPALVDVPADIQVAPLAGACEASVAFSLPTATDNCDPAPLVVLVRSDNLPLGAPYPVGVTTVTVTATDACLNFTLQTFDVTVEGTTQVDVEVVLEGVFTSVSRCITFRTDDCAQVSEVLDFGDHDLDPSTPVQAVASVTLPCGLYHSLCAKDAQHTLSGTTTLSGHGSAGYVGDSVLVLDGGDADDDGDVDINDVTLFLAQFGGLASAGACPWDGATHDTDFSNNGAVGSDDYVFLTANWLSITSCGCALTQGGPKRDAQVRVEVRTGLQRAADVNADGFVDVRDVQLFEQQHGLSGALSERMGR